MIVTLLHRPRRVESIRIVKCDVHLHRLAVVNPSEAFDDVQFFSM